MAAAAFDGGHATTNYPVCNGRMRGQRNERTIGRRNERQHSKGGAVRG